ncbi:MULTISPECIES: capsule biosynthesis protein [Kordiimonas]|jgi:capsular polysaccharide export protein|uniref:Capsular polysaccharide export protein n=1 Tax=Kordiimonas lacus TaxID=637679 RepID=A0A1G7F8Z0_9PROT|nr:MULTISPECIES: capsular biosynthesis protein [Kordiimonas]SDE72367.1 capsular polysaccharide export protein [Kordiimonas lacus]
MKNGIPATDTDHPASMADMALEGRSILFLQGLATPFFETLACKLARAGASVHRAHFCGGDWAFRGGTVAGVSHHAYGDTLDSLPDWYEALITEHGIDTIILLGDCRPIHAPARQIAADRGLTLYAFDEGYIRPGFVTMEAGGTNGYSHMPKDADVISKLAADGPRQEASTPIKTNMGRRARMDILAHGANIIYRSRFPHFQSHRPASIWQEAGGWIKRGARSVMHGSANKATIAHIEAAQVPYFLVPLQLNSDYQIRIHSRFDGMPAFIDEIMQSFAANAPGECHLFFKNHPLDNGIIDYRSIIAKKAAALGITGRVSFAAGGDLDRIITNARGVVLVNSTVGFATLRLTRPLKALGTAVYDIEGLTDAQPLDAFWQNPQPPQQRLAEEFLTVVETYTQVRGDFFSEAGIERASHEAARVIAGALPRLPTA